MVYIITIIIIILLEVSNRKLSAASLHCSWYAVTSHSLTLSAPASLSTSIFSLQYHETILKKNWTSFVEFLGWKG